MSSTTVACSIEDEAGAFQKAVDGRLRRADARAFLFLVAVGLARGQARDMQHEPARRRMGDRAFVEQPAFDQRVGDEALEVRRRAGLHTRGDFFAEEFEQKFGHGRRAIGAAAA